MNLTQLQEEISILVIDGSYTPDVITGYINQCIEYINDLVVLPGLKRIVSADTVLNQNYTAIAGSFNRRLLGIKNSENGTIEIYKNLELLFNSYSDLLEAGSIEAVCLEGNTLWYVKVPDAVVSLQLLLYNKIPVLSVAAPTVQYIPEGLQRRLLIYGTAWIIFDQIEEDITEAKLNARNYFYHSFDETNRHSGIIKLKEWIGKTRNHHISSVWNV